jgi:class 3 adenylate cyclase/tetratricopeptide (TPR) repeat protein
MSFLETVDRARSHLERNGRVSLRALQREFGLDDESLDELVEELVDTQRVAVREGKALAWSGGDAQASLARDSESGVAGNAESADKPKPRLEGELKQATVLFADVKSSTALAEKVGAERWAGILDGYIRILEAGIRRFDGTVSQYTGDGMMALFGAPIAQEDHAQRACLSALWLRDTLRDYAEQVESQHGLIFETRIGLHSGEVVVGKIGDDLGIDFMAQGQTVHLAQRMEQLAESERPRISAATAGLVAGLFALDDLGEFEVKGSSKPVRVYGLTGLGEAHSRLDAARTRGLTGFVGRTHEMASLDGALAQAREGKGQIVGVVGEAGVGKSRLCAEFLERTEASGVPVYSAHCLSHAQTVAYLPVYELLRTLLGRVSEQDSEAEQRRRIVDGLLAFDATLGEMLPIVLDFLGLPDPERPAPPLPPEARQRQLYDFAQRLVRALGGVAPFVIFLDDTHWIDSASDAFLAHLVEAVSGTPVLLLVNFRPQYHADWMGRSAYQQLSLQSLGHDDTERLLAELLGRDPAFEGLIELIRERTDGNPFFVEEVVRALADSGSLKGARGAYRLVAPIESLEVPSSVQPVLANRIDRLPDRERQVLQAASVIGREFSEAILLEVLVWRSVDLSEALHALKAGEFIREQSLYPVVEYAFKHPLTQEVALESQLEGRRARTHAAVARALEKVHSDRLDEHAALIANHYEEAGQSLEAATWHQRAALSQLQRGDLDFDAWRMMRVYELAKSVQPETPESTALVLGASSMIIMLAGVVRIPMDERDGLAAEARSLAERSGDRIALFILELGLATSRILNGWSGEGPLPPAERAAAIAADLPPIFQASASFTLGNIYFHTGRLHNGVRDTERALEITAGDLDMKNEIGVSIELFAKWQKGSVLMWMGRHREAEEQFDGCFELSRERPDQAEFIAWIVGTWSGPPLEELTGLPRQSLALCRRALEVAEASPSPSPFMLLFAWKYLGWAHLMRGEAKEALDFLLRADTLQRPGELGVVQWNLGQGLLAEAYLAAGDRENARIVADRCVTDFDSWVFELRAHISRARVLRGLDGADARQAIEATLDRAEALLEMSDARAFAPMIAEERARLFEVLGDADGATRTLREALRLFEEIGATGHVERLRKELAA